MIYQDVLQPTRRGRLLRATGLALSVCLFSAAALADTVDYLVVGGGGGGGDANNSTSGGGGGGSVEYVSGISLGLGTYTVTVGAGGAHGAAGSNSIFNGTTGYGGGRGGSTTSGGATSGGSGGGGYTNSGGAAAGSGSNVYGGGGGDNGGNGWAAGGGGGAGGTGGGLQLWPGAINFNGGAGISNSITGTATYYGGGGGGGCMNTGNATSGGVGGGGGCPNGQAGTNGAANTGGGGGGGGADNNSGTPYNGGSGGSGVVIIRYAGAQHATGGTVSSAGGYTIHTFTSSGSLVLSNPVPVITSPTAASATQGQAITAYTITATNSPTSYNATNLPAGLSVNTTTGVITGTPTVSGNVSSTITASNSNGPGNAPLNWTIAGGAPVITPQPPPSLVQGQAMPPYQITATNNPTNFSATGLPAGLSLNTTTGVITGTPTVAGSITSTIGASNAYGSDSKSLAWTIAIGTPIITSATTASATQGQSVSYQILATNGPTSFTATNLPAGLSLNTATGVISGAPTVSGSYTSGISASNATGTGGSVSLVWTIAGPIVMVTPGNTGTAVINGNVGVGTSAPLALLDIQVPNSSNVNEGLVVERFGGASLFGFKLKSDGTGNYRGALTVKPNGGAEMEALTVMADQHTGNVGIGTNAPWSTLQVVGPASEPSLINQSQAIQSWNWLTGSELDLTISNASPYTISFQTRYTGGSNTTYPLALNPLGGNVGIGTTTPSFPLSLGTGLGNKLALYDAGGGAGYGFGIQDNLLQIYANTANDRVGLGYGNSGSFSETLTVKGGRVGIGTTNPSHKLAVNGTIRAKEVIVDTGWADHVFAEDYPLASLTEVETHIRDRKHLPGIPSAAEVAAAGVNLGDMQVKLLEKIEELTLHLISQEKQFRRLQDENTVLRRRLDQLEKRNTP